MALTKKLKKEDNEYKIDFESTYFKIDTFYIDVIDNVITLGVRGYPDKYSRDNNGIGIFKKVYETKIDDLKIETFTKNEIVSKTYEYLKTLDEFKDAKDC